MAPSAGADLRSYTGFLLRRAYVRAVGIEQACIGDDARIREISILIILDELGAVSQREVAELTHISPTVMVRLVDGLEAARLGHPRAQRRGPPGLRAAADDGRPDRPAPAQHSTWTRPTSS